MTAEPRRPTDIDAVALLAEPTRRRLYDFVAGREAPVSRDAAAATLGISRELAAFHLDRLVAGGLLRAEARRLGVRKGPGGGRPTKLYVRAERAFAVSLPPRDYEVAAELFADALGQLPPEASREPLDRVAHARGRAIGAAARSALGRGARSREFQAAALVDVLAAAGYEPIAEADGGTIRLRNCRFQGLATSHRELTCGMNLAWAKGVVDGLGAAGVRAEAIPDPDPCCVAFISSRATRKPAP
jgi:predicted ArsR family transcriptional regulator